MTSSLPISTWPSPCQVGQRCFATKPPSPALSHRAWDALRSATRCRALVVFHHGRCVMHAGAGARGVTPGGATMGPICTRALETGSGTYLANLVLYPGVAQAHPMACSTNLPELCCNQAKLSSAHSERVYTTGLSTHLANLVMHPGTPQGSRVRLQHMFGKACAPCIPLALGTHDCSSDELQTSPGQPCAV